MITQKELRNIMEYNPDTGIFKMIKKTSRRVSCDDDVGNYARKNHNGKAYLNVCINYKTYSIHRLAFLYMEGSFPKEQIDHINGNGTDNRWCNLRKVSQSENSRNMKLFSTNNSGVTGVSWFKRLSKWRARVKVDYKDITIGYFDNIFDAVCARKNAEVKYGFHRNHGSERSL